MKNIFAFVLVMSLCMSVLASCANPGEKPATDKPGASGVTDAAGNSAKDTDVTDAITDAPDTEAVTDAPEDAGAYLDRVFAGYRNVIDVTSDALPDNDSFGGYDDTVAVRVTDVPGVGFTVEPDSFAIAHVYANAREIGIPDDLRYNGNFFSVGTAGEVILVDAANNGDLPLTGGFILIGKSDETFVLSTDEKYSITLSITDGKITFERRNLAYVGIQAIQMWLDRYVSEDDFYMDIGTVTLKDGKAVFEAGEMFTVYSIYAKYEKDPLPTFAEFVYREVRAIGMTDEELRKYPRILDAMK